MQIKPRPRSRKPSKSHSPPMMQLCKLELPSHHSTRTRRTSQDLTNTSPPSPSFQPALESPTTMPCWNGSSKDLIHKLWYNSLSQEQLKPLPLWRSFTQRPLRLREATATLHHSGENLNHPMEEVVITMIPMLWTWITSYYPWLSKLTICMKITTSYVIRKAVLLGIILVTIRVTQQVVGATTQNHPRLPMPQLSPPPPIQSLPSWSESRTAKSLEQMHW